MQSQWNFVSIELIQIAGSVLLVRVTYNLSVGYEVRVFHKVTCQICQVCWIDYIQENLHLTLKWNCQCIQIAVLLDNMKIRISSKICMYYKNKFVQLWWFNIL